MDCVNLDDYKFNRGSLVYSVLCGSSFFLKYLMQFLVFRVLLWIFGYVFFSFYQWRRYIGVFFYVEIVGFIYGFFFKIVNYFVLCFQGISLFYREFDYFDIQNNIIGEL